MYETDTRVAAPTCEPRNPVLSEMVGNAFSAQIETYRQLSSMEERITGKKVDPAEFPEPTCLAQHMSYVEEMAKRNAEIAYRLSSLV